jgi:hypothetical protein
MRWLECHMATDEATSHLDVATETRVSRHTAALGITRIIVAHGRRPSRRLTAWWGSSAGRCIEQARVGAARGAAADAGAVDPALRRTANYGGRDARTVTRSTFEPTTNLNSVVSTQHLQGKQ